DIPNLDVLPAGPIHPSPAELLRTAKMSALIAECKARYDLVYIDATPLLSVSDASILTRNVDGIILVVRATHVKKEQLHKANQILAPSKHKILGVILNDKKIDQYSIV